MTAIKATWKNGQIVPDGTVDWPEGCRLIIEPVAEEATLGIREEDWPETPEGIARHMALMDQIEPLIMTPEEEAEWRAALKAQKDFDKANFEERAKRIEGLFP
jgi:hypothetical protein